MCIEYDLNSFNEINNRDSKSFLPVVYANKIDLTLDLNDEEYIRYTCMVNSILKHKDWSYENEWRLISYNDDEKKFKNLKINAIYFGIYTSEEDKNMIIDLLNKSDQTVEFYQMKADYRGLWQEKIKQLD
ncbi:DUF2971 domain-containing protein [Clostridium sp. 19966]|uniref:DUF2971 domain-containing protein n=1 Tax=Clostridium sp. 19966 TaxID=2768166 RepID=UPI0028EEC4F1|nr:DUF2971 domain-containing protein [Clostridium sp. 19966]